MKNYLYPFILVLSACVPVEEYSTYEIVNGTGETITIEIVNATE